MRRPLVGSLASVAVLLAACGGSSQSSPATDQPSATDPTGDCGPAPTEMAAPPELPAGFPTPAGVVYTGAETAGPTSIVHGIADGDLSAVFESYVQAFPGAGYDVTRSEQEERDAEVNFAGAGADGQVKLEAECEGRVTITITIRPLD